MNPKYPVYIISKGRWEQRLTAKTFEHMNMPYRIVIEPQEYEQYANVIDKDKILTLPFSNLGQGSIPARNWVWEHSIEEGHKRHWIFDDNIRWIYWFNKNRKIKCATGTPLKIIEDFTDRYENAAIVGMHYQFFAPAREKKPPLYFNTRIYSNLLIDNSLDIRWRGKYNEDTDLSLRVLKKKLCTVLFNVFLVGKMATMINKGGNTDELYADDGRKKMAMSLAEQHPDVVRVVRKWGRWQHQVDYRPFRTNKLLFKKGVKVEDGVNNYGLKLVENV